MKRIAKMDKKQDKELQDVGNDIFRSVNAVNALNKMKENFKFYKEQIRLFQKLRMVKYKALMDEGFSKEQALDIIEKTRIFE
jgi:hypothetical protein